MDEADGATEFDGDDMPPGYILVRQEDGIYSFVKLEPQEQEEIIEEVEEMELADADQVEELIEDSNQKTGYLEFPEEQTLDELEIDDIPDIIEEELSPGSFDQTITDAQVEFVDATPEFGTLSITVSKEKKPTQKQPPLRPGTVSWKGLQIPAELSPEGVERFKGRVILQRLLEQVKRNRSKVEIYSKKNDELKKLISNQASKPAVGSLALARPIRRRKNLLFYGHIRLLIGPGTARDPSAGFDAYWKRQQMMNLGFHAKDIARFHSTKRKSRQLPRPLSPEINKSLMTDTERLAYEQKRLEAEYSFYRRSLKAILSSHRRFKKIFVENHEKIQKGPQRKAVTLASLPVMYRQTIRAIPHQMSEASDSGSEQSDSQGTKPAKIFKCYHCNYSAATKDALVPHIQIHLVPPKAYKCPSCPYTNFKVTQFLEHMKRHPGVKAFTCDHCDFKTAHPAALKNHKSLHMAVKPYKCPMCPLRFGRSDHLRNHVRCHSNVRSYKCELCPYASKYASGLANHIRRLHKKLYRKKKMTSMSSQNTNEEVSESDDPGETTEIEVDETGKISAIRTISRKHAKEDSDIEEQPRASSRRKAKNKVYADFTDGEEFDEVLIKSEDVEDGNFVEEEGGEEESEGEVVEEEREYETIVEDAPGTFYEDLGEEDEEQDIAEEESDYAESQVSKRKDLLSSYVIYQCVWCDFNCEMRSGLLEHSRNHMLSWTFTCKACGFEAKSPMDLQVHTEDHKNAGEFDCWYCDYVTSNKVKLKKHVEKRHPAGKPMSCMHCDFMSSSRMKMKSHMTAHKTKKVWQCTLCDYKAPFRSSLKRHLRKHTGERPYCCPHCEFNATQYSHLTRHLRKYHPEEPALLENRPPSPFVPIF